MKLKNEEAIDLAHNLANFNVILKKYEADFVESMVKISSKPGVITLTEGQEDVYNEIIIKLSLGKIKYLSK